MTIVRAIVSDLLFVIAGILAIALIDEPNDLVYLGGIVVSLGAGVIACTEADVKFFQFLKECYNERIP